MSLADLWTWLWTGHRHVSTAVELAPLVTGNRWRAGLVEVDRCACGAVRPVGSAGLWTMPMEDE